MGPIMNSILEACSGLCNQASDSDTLFELIIDCSALIDTKLIAKNCRLSNDCVLLLKMKYLQL